MNYLANVPEVLDLAKHVKAALPGCIVFAGGHSVSFVAGHVLAQAGGAIDVVLKGEGETGAPALLAAAADRALAEVPGAVTREGTGPPPAMAHSLDDHLPARHLGGHRRKYFHWGDGSGCLDRVHPRMPMGLLVLQCLDVLRPQLPEAVAGGRR